jgi:diguanylate cyclase (GGDEF)-like protein
MYSFSSFTPNDLLEKYKRQTYLIAFPIGMILSALYIMNFARSGMQFYVASAIFLELGICIFLILFAPPIKYAMEFVFYFLTPVLFFILTQFHIEVYLKNNFVLDDPVYSLSMWLIVFLIGAFLSLKPEHIRMFIIFIFAGMTLLAVNNLRVLYFSNELQFANVFRWVNAFISMGIATLLIRWIGLLQQRSAVTDALTGLLNRHALYPILNQELERAARYARPFSIVLFDIDEFKAVNDTFGHLEGDKVLRELSKLVSGLLRKTDYAGRWGGEEFLLILPESDTAEAVILAERIRMKIEDTFFTQVYNVTASFSVVAYRTSQSLEALIECADKALVQAKNNGRNQVIVFQEESS